MPNLLAGLELSGQEMEFSSPLVAKERREEVDLDTGHRRSWVVEKEFDIYDLTELCPGESPAPVTGSSSGVSTVQPTSCDLVDLTGNTLNKPLFSSPAG